MSEGYWYCPACGEEVGAWHVSPQELHTQCGHPVSWINPGKPSYEKLEAEIERLLSLHRGRRDQ